MPDRVKEKLVKLICGCLIYIVVAVIAVLTTFFIYNAVMAADIPNWIKYLILR